MRFILEIDLGEMPSATILATQLYRQANLFSTATERLKPQVFGIDDPRTMATAGKWEIREGETLAEISQRDVAFNRPHHALAYGFIEIGGFLKEFDPAGNLSLTLPRLTAEDLKATDWKEVILPESFEDEARRVFGACGGKCGDPPCVAWNEKHRKRS